MKNKKSAPPTKIVHVCYNLIGADETNIKNAAVSILSILNNTHASLHFHIFCSGQLSEQDESIFAQLTVANNQGFTLYTTDYDGIAPLTHILSNLPPEVKKVVYLKDDTIVVTDILNLYRENTGKNGIAAVPEQIVVGELSTSSLCEADLVNREDYFNAEVLLVNLEKLRKANPNLYVAVEKFLREHPECMEDEDEALNYFISAEYQKLHNSYNYMVPFYRASKLDCIYKGIYNFAGEKKDIPDILSDMFFSFYNVLPYGNSEQENQKRQNLPENTELASFLPFTSARLNILVMESESYLPIIRLKMPRARIYSLNQNPNIVNNPAYKDLNIQWVNLEFWREPLDLPPESFDFIFSEEIFSIVEDIPSFLQSLGNILRKTGDILLTCPNTLHWNTILKLMAKEYIPPNSVLWNIDTALQKIRRVVFLNDIKVMENRLPAPPEIREKLLSIGYNNDNNIMDVSSWHIKAGKSSDQLKQLKLHYSANVRKQLTDMLRRIEYGVDAKKNTQAIISLWESKKISSEYMALYIRLVVVLHAKFLDNFAPTMIQAQKKQMIEEMLKYFANMNSGLNSFDRWLSTSIIKESKEANVNQKRVKDCLKEKIESSDKKIAFISCVNNDEMYGESLRYINNLIVPDGYGVEIVAILDAKSMCNGYNKAMKLSNAKYKVYIHQDCYLVNEHFIEDMLKVFSDESVGIMGAVGPKVLPPSGISWYGENYGALLQATDGELIFPYNAKNPQGIYEEVECVDGLMIATQYDIPWREDIFDSWHLYDTSYCMEMHRRGYKTVVPQQSFTWFIHCPPQRRLDPRYKGYQRKFLNEYGKELIVNRV